MPQSQLWFVNHNAASTSANWTRFQRVSGVGVLPAVNKKVVPETASNEFKLGNRTKAVSYRPQKRSFVARNQEIQ